MPLVDDLYEKKNRFDTAVVSKMLSSTDSFEEALEIGLRPEMVTEPSARRALECAYKFYEEEGRSVPTFEYIKMRGIPFHPVSTPDTVQQLVPAVRELSTSLRLTSLQNAIPRLLSGNAVEAADRVYKTALEISEISKAKEPVKTKKDIAEEMQAAYAAEEGMANGGAIPYGFPILSGLLNGKVGVPSITVFFGAPKNYKTTNLVWDAYFLAVKLGYCVYIVSGELKREDIMMEMSCFHARVDIDKVRKRQLTAEDRLAYFDSLSFIAGLDNLHIGESPRRGIMELDLMVSRAEKVKPQVVYLDGVHRLPDTPDHQDVIKYAQRVTEHATHSTGCPWVVAAQANREAAKREYESQKNDNKRHKGVTSAMLDIAGSKAWIEECTAAIRCVKKGHGRVWLEVTETRYGTNGTVEVSMLRGFNIAEIKLVVDDEQQPQ